VFVDALWGALVCPVIVSCYWDRVTNKAFTWAVVSAVVLFTIARFELVSMTGVVALLFESIASVGAAVVLGLMTFAFFSRNVAIGVVALTLVIILSFAVGFLSDYSGLLASLTAYGTSALVCVALSLR